MSFASWKRWGFGAGGFIGILAIVALLALGSFGSRAQTAQAQTADPNQPGNTSNRSITVNAVGKVQAAPDVAYLNVGSTVQAPTAKEALDKATAAVEKIRQALVDAGIPDQDIQTQGVSTYPIIPPGKEGGDSTADPTGYRSNVNLQVTINDLSKAGTALDAATKAGANQIGGLNYGLKDDSTLRAQALEQAVKQARPKAEAIARGLSLQLGQVVTVVEDPNGYYGGPAAASGKGGDGLAPGQLTVSVSVRVSYAIQ
jgi:uncharacterized protein YggE